MATVSTKLINTVSKFFSGYSREDNDCTGNEFFYNGGFNKFMTLKSCAENEIPVFCFETICRHIRTPQNEVIIPLSYRKYNAGKSYKSAHMLLYHLIQTPLMGGRLTRVSASSGEMFYGSSGLLMDSNMNPMMLATVKTSTSLGVINLEELILYISPNIFTEEGFLNKYIRDKVIPYVLSGAPFNCSIIPGINDNIARINYVQVIPKIIISDSINRFFISTPKNEEDNHLEILLGNVDDITDICIGL